MKEDRDDKNLPQIIDVEVEADIDFELREPEDDKGGSNPYEAHSYEGHKSYEAEEIIDVETNTEELDFEPYQAYSQTVEGDTQTIHKDEKEEARDTSFTTFKASQKVGEKKWRKKILGKFGNLVGLLLACIVGIPVLGFGGFFGVLGAGMGILFCGMAFGMGVIGLGASAFMATAEIAGLAGIVFFMSLVGIGGGGLGLLIILAILILLKNMIVKCYGSIRKKFTQEVA